MKIIYITNSFLDQWDGASKKILAQTSALKELGHDIDLLSFKNRKILLNTKEIGHIYGHKIRILFLMKIVLMKIVLNNYNVLYLRYIYPSIFSLIIVLISKIKNHRLKIYIEIPTYPYSGEKIIGLSSLIIFKLDTFFSMFFKFFITKIVTFSDDEKIFNVKCINVLNGYNPIKENIKYTIKVKDKNKTTFNFICVSSIEYWHGIDRFIMAIKNYNKNNITFDIVGNGKQFSYILNLIKEDDYLQKVVTCHGILYGNQLQELYLKADIAVGSLGRHRSGIFKIQPLKNREYAANGLPIIFSEEDLGFNDANFIYKVSADEELISISDIIQWYINMDFSRENIIQYSKKFLWKQQMSKIMNDIKF
jgi:glycosyltransferase involved in cell wall biosynthesis